MTARSYGVSLMALLAAAGCSKSDFSWDTMHSCAVNSAFCATGSTSNSGNGSGSGSGSGSGIPLVVENSTPASSSNYTGAAFGTQPVFGVYPSGSASPDASLSDSIELQAYLDSGCSTTVADGTLSALSNPLALSSGVASFSELLYTLPGHLEETIYLKASAVQSAVSLCVSTGISILQHFNAGTGYVFSGATDAAGTSGNDDTSAFQFDSQGRIVIAGWSTNATTGATEAAIWRYYPDGTLDTSFNSPNGYVTTGSTGTAGGTGTFETDQADFLQIDSLGRIVVVGTSRNTAHGYELAVWRYNADGTLDTTFNSPNGFVLFGTTGAAGGTGSGENDFATAVQIDQSGRLVIVGQSENTGGGYELALWRYTASGVLDTSFNSPNGYFHWGSTGLAGETGINENDYPNALQLDSSGNIIVAGRSQSSSGPRLAIWRFTANGLLDTSFDSPNGYVLSGATGAAGGSSDVALSLQLDSSGNLVLSGQSQNISGGTEAAIWRYTSSGSLDTTFNSPKGYAISGATGVAGAVSSLEFESPNFLQIDSSGRYVMAGSSANAITIPGAGTQLAIWRYNANGTPDTSFGSGGYVVSAATGIAGATGTNEDDTANIFQIDSHGRYVLVGGSNDTSGNTRLAIWRYLSTGVVDK